MCKLRESDVLVDLCTQRDYLVNGSGWKVANVDQVLANIKHLMGWARWARLPVISSVDERRPEEAVAGDRPPCVLGTRGQKKVSYSLMPDRVRIESDNCLCVSLDILEHHQQAILSKQHRDPLTNPKLDRLLTEMPAKRFVVFGVSMDSCIRSLVLGLLLRERRVLVVSDACGYWNDAEADFSERQIIAKGCALTSTSTYIHHCAMRNDLWRKPRLNQKRFVA